MNEEPLDLRRFSRAVSTGRWIMVATVVIGVLVGVGVAAVQTPQYS